MNWASYERNLPTSREMISYVPNLYVKDGATTCSVLLVSSFLLLKLSCFYGGHDTCLFSESIEFHGVRIQRLFF